MSERQQTPLFQQYHQVKRKHGGMLLLFRMGDFYELFYEDAERAAALLGITLTKRSNQGRSVPMAGVPVHSLQQYMARLVRLGESVAVCEQVGEQEDGKIIRREVTQIVTPGTLTDSGLLEERTSCIAMAVCETPVKCGYAWLDLAGLKLRAGACRPDELAGHIARIDPAEMLLAEGASLPPGVSCTVGHLPEWEFDCQRSATLLAERLGMRDLAGVGLADEPLAAAAASALLGYAEHTQCRQLKGLVSVGAELADRYLYMPPETRRSLEITASLAGEGPTLFSTVDLCACAMGSRTLRHRLHHPLVQTQELQARQDVWTALLDSKGRDVALAWLGRCCDLERIAARIDLESVRPRELAALRDTLRELPALQDALADLPEAVAKRRAALFADRRELLAIIESTLAEEPAAAVRDGGVIASAASAQLAQLRSAGADIESALSALLDAEKQRSGIETLRIGRNRVQGIYYELVRSQAQRAPAHFRRLQTLKNAERYITDELAVAQDETASASEKALRLEAQLYAQLVARLREQSAQLHELAAALADLDVAGCCARLADERNWVRPAYAQQPQLAISRGRHPVVEQTVEYFEPNSVELNEQCRMMVLTGPNMGGKSTYMRQAAIIALLAHVGAPVPADAATIGGLKSIQTRIGAADDLAGGRSTFMVEMAETAAILNTATAGSLVILDEIGRGTSTYDGLSLAWATAESLLDDNRSLVLLATHYFELAELGDRQPAAANFHMAVGEHRGEAVMLHRLEKGAASRSFGLQVAQMAGIPAATLAAARRRLEMLLAANGSVAPSGDLFAESQSQSATHRSELASRISQVDLDGLSARDALQLLYELRDLAAERD